MDRILIAGTHSGCGKTTVTCAVLTALKQRGLNPSAFKCGPDYIDPMFHRRAIGVPSRNLDPFFCDEQGLKGQLAGPGLAIIEGAMGYYDGVSCDGRFSAYEVARLTRTPVVLVLDVKGMYASMGAVLQGFARYREDSGISGVIFNNASPKLNAGLSAIARQVGIRPLGYLPRAVKATVASRHLGLVSAEEIGELEEKLQTLGDLAERCIDLDGLLELAAGSPGLTGEPEAIRPLGSIRLAVARDEAFSFFYEENLELLRALGCQLEFFSPMRDPALPQGVAGLYLCGGYPELHLEALSGNRTMLESVRWAVRGGLPTIAECGGFLYLHDQLDGIPLAGVVPARARTTDRLSRFGYVTLRAGVDNLLCGAKDTIRSHEFHYCESTAPGGDFTAEKPLSDRSWPCIHATPTLYAGFPHLYFPANPEFARRFVTGCLAYDRTIRSDRQNQSDRKNRSELIGPPETINHNGGRL